jgi:hypothetical protein
MDKASGVTLLFPHILGRHIWNRTTNLIGQAPEWCRRKSCRPKSAIAIAWATESASKVHKDYGTRTTLTSLLEDMLKIFAVTDWGYYEE